MESISCAAKRKKRKTRKCLDELRKRSQRNICENADPGTRKTEYKTSTNSERNPNIYITSKRLTLEMFPKVIRSETVTRPAFSEIHEDYNLDLDKMTMKGSIKPDADNLITIPQSNSDSAKSLEDNYVDTINRTLESCLRTSQKSRWKESNSSNLSPHDHSLGSLPLFSPVNKSDDTDLFDASSKETLPSTSAQSTHNSEHTGLGNFEALYAEFVSEIPIYLEQYAAGLLEGDPMKNTREMIHKMHLDSLNKAQHQEDKVYQDMRREIMALKGSESESLEPVPRKYMRLGRRVGGLSREAARGAPPATSTAPVPALAPTALLDTPEYTYYPHKLNQ